MLLEPTHEPAPAISGWAGSLMHIHIAPAGSHEMQELEAAMLVAGKGIEGDRYFLGTGTYSSSSSVKEITLIEAEVLDAIARNDPPVQAAPLVISPMDHRRNLTTRGVPLAHLVGRRFQVGEAILFGDHLNAPCKYLEQLLDMPVFMPLFNRSGLNCAIERGGRIAVGDKIVPL